MAAKVVFGVRHDARKCNIGLLLANNEFGLGKNAAFNNSDGRWTRFSKSMVAVEFALEMYASGRG